MALRTDSMIGVIKGRYDADNDIIPGTPIVTATDYALLQIIEDLKLRIEALEAQAVERVNAEYRPRYSGTGGA